MTHDRGDGGPHLDVLLEDEFSQFVADGLTPDVVVGAYKERINLGIDSQDGSVDIYLGNLSADEARSLAALLSRAADAVESGPLGADGQTWVLGDDE